MFKKMLVVLVATLFISSPAFAHVMNADDHFTDVSMSEQKEAILFIETLQLIPGESTKFEPTTKLTRVDFALSYSQFKKRVGSQEELVQQAIEMKIIDSANGNVTVAEVNRALFNNQVVVKDSSAEMTNEQYAQFIYAHALEIQPKLITEVNYVEGPTGVISKVTQDNERFILTINGEQYTLTAHPSVVNDSTDPLVWQGQQVTTSLSPSTNKQTIQFLTVKEKSKSVTNEVTEEKTTAENLEISSSTKVDTEDKQSNNSLFISIIGIVIVALIVGLFFKIRNRKGR